MAHSLSGPKLAVRNTSFLPGQAALGGQMNQLRCVLLSTAGGLMCDFSGLLKLKRFCSETGAFLASRAEVLGGQTWAETPHEGQRLCACQLSPAGLWAAVDNGLRRSGRQKLVVQGSVCLPFGSWTAHDGPGGMWRRGPCGGRERKGADPQSRTGTLPASQSCRGSFCGGHSLSSCPSGLTHLDSEAS